MAKKETTIDELATIMHGHFDRQEKKTDEKIDGLAIMIQKQFSHHEKRFDGIDKRFEKIEKNMVTKTDLDTSINSLRSEMNTDISSLRSEINFRFDKLDEQISDIKIRLDRLEKNLNDEVYAFADDILDLRKRISVLEKQIKVLKLAK